MITISQKGDFKNTERFLSNAKNLNILNILNKYGTIGVNSLARATPVDTGLTSISWGYKIDRTTGKYIITWFNTNVNNGSVIAILIQYGHGTKNGGYVQPLDYINPAMKSVFDQIAEDIWKEVISL